MTRAEFNAAFVLAQSTVHLGIYYEDLHLFHGFGLGGFRPVCCTLPQIAALLRWQGKFLGNGWDMDAVNEVWRHGRYKFTVVGPGGDDTARLPGALLAQALGVEGYAA